MSVPATVCPYCREPVLCFEEARCCQVCGTREHRACWQEYNHCSVYGCSGKSAPVVKTHNIWKIIPALLMLFASRDGFAFASFASFYLVGILFCISEVMANASILRGLDRSGHSLSDELWAAVKILLNLSPIVFVIRSIVL